MGRTSAWAFLVLLAPLAGCFGGGDGDGAPAPAPGGFSDADVFPGIYDKTLEYSRVLEDGPHRILAPERVTLQSDLDGEPIALLLVRPDLPAGETAPVILHPSVYLPPLGRANIRTATSTIDPRFLIDNYVPHGYAVAFANARGTGDSGGCWDFYGPRERADLSQAVTWLATRDWSNGHVGTIGRSFDANTQWTTAATGNPHLKTVVTMASEPDYYTWVVRNGTPSGLAAPFEYLGFTMMASTGQYALLNDQGAGAEKTRDPQHAVKMACDTLAEAQEAHVETTRTGERVDHAWVRERDLRPLVEENYQGSALVVHGLQDFFAPPHLSLPWATQLESHNVTVKLLLGQWGHHNPDQTTGTLRWDWAEILLHWFDYWLKGDTTRDLGPRVQVADSQDRWRSEDAWPPRDAEWTTFHLAPDGALVTEPAAASGTARLPPQPARVLYDPTTYEEDLRNPATQACAQCPTFATPPFPEPFRFAGLPQVHLTVTPRGPGGHVTAYLYQENETGRQRLGWGQIDLRFADGGEQARDVAAGQPLEVLLELEPLDAVVHAGGRLVLELFQGGYGDTFFYYRGSVPTYPVDVHVGGDASVVRVQSFQRDDGEFFEAP